MIKCNKSGSLRKGTIIQQNKRQRNKMGIRPEEYFIVDLFSGCGGMSWGFHSYNKGDVVFNVCAAADSDQHANATYKLNFGIEPWTVDFTSLPTAEIAVWIKKICKGNTDRLILIGCAPCQGFSSHQKKRKITTPDARNSLLVWFAELAALVKPLFVISENVPDLICEKNWLFYKKYVDILIASGYKISSGIVNMAQYGVPQERHRTVIISSRKFIPTLPPQTRDRDSFATVRDAIGSLPRLSIGQTDPNDSMHETSKHRENTVNIFKKIPKDGGSRPRGIGPKCLDRVSGFFDVYGRLWWDKPAVTITARCRTPSCGRFMHPEQDRGLSIREAACLQGFPIDFELSGPFDDKFKQIGNAVPPIFSQQLASHLASIITRRQVGGRGINTFVVAPVAKSYSGVIAGMKTNRSRQAGRK